MFKSVYYDFKTKKIHLWETFNGKTSKLVEDYTYEYYASDDSGTSHIRDVYGNPVKLQTTRDKKRIESLKEAGVNLCESDLQESICFLQKRYKGVELDPKVEDFDIAYMDIEVAGDDEFPEPEKALYPINLITIISSKTGETHTWGTSEYTGDSKLVKNYTYIPDEKRMLENFIRWMRKRKFDIISGWNVEQFDIQTILRRCLAHGITVSLSPINKVTYKNTENKGKKNFYCNIAGLVILDMMKLYKNFTYDQLASYSLNFVALEEEVGGKLELEGHINDVYKTDWNRFVEYNIVDTQLCERIENKKKFIELSLKIASQSLIPIDKVYSSVAITEGYMLKLLHSKNMVMPDRKTVKTDMWKELGLWKHGDELQNVKYEDGEKDFEAFAVKGAHVAATPGLYKSLVGEDIESLYPRTIQMFNISPETKVFNPTVEQIENEDLIKSPINGVYYRRKKGVLPAAVESVFTEKQEFERLAEEAENSGDKELAKFYKSQRHIRKIMINAMYGVLLNKFFHFYDVDNARVVTRHGRKIIQFIASTTNKYFREIVPKLLPTFFPGCPAITIDEDVVKIIDTDSNYICLDNIKKAIAPNMGLIEFATIIEQNILEPFYENILDIWAKRFGTEQMINIKREGIIIKQFCLAKKKYLSLLAANKGVVFKKPELEIKGVEIKRSDTPTFCRDKIEKVVDCLFEGEDPDKDKVIALLKSIKKEFKKQRLPDIAFNKGVYGFMKYSEPIEKTLKRGFIKIKKSTPMHVRASMYYNFLIEENKLGYMKVSDGTKIKYIHTNPKNRFDTDTIAFIGNWPTEFDDIFEIDYDYQFEKSFLGVIQRMFDVLNWGKINFRAGSLNKFLKSRRKKVHGTKDK